MITKDQIREVFLKNGFTIKEGQTDLKPYVYNAAEELVSLILEVINSKLVEAMNEQFNLEQDFNNRGSD
jgi:hypothetical protein